VSEISQTLLFKALDGLAMRQTAIAENIANSGSEVFAIRSVDFEGALREAAQQGPEAVRNLTINFSSGPQTSGDAIRLDLQMQDASSTAMRYSALTDLLGRQMQVMRAAIRGGQ